MPARKGHEVIPSARRLIGSLRDMGYEFATAVADLVDNCIEAGASRAEVWIEFEGDESWVRIADNGRGMTAAVLREAMRYGSERDYGDNDLGKFGLGMKTASMSQCRRLTVASRPKSGAPLSAYSWDLDHIEKTDRWEVLPIKKSELPNSIAGPLGNGFRTVVLWEQLDRLLGYKHPYGEFQRKQLAQMCREVEDHLAMVFHRFLCGEARGRRLQISLNGNPIEAWDPFARKELRTRKLEGCSIPFEQDEVRGEISIQPYVLPHEHGFSSQEARAKASGPLKWNRQQGFYIYRADRLIQSGGWSNLRTLDEHTKLARVAVSFSPNLDEAFKINVAKMRVQIPVLVRDDIDRALIPVLRAAQAEYRRGGQGKNAPVPSLKPAPAPSTSSPMALPLTASPPSSNVSAPVARRFTLDEFRGQLESVATLQELPAIEAVCERLNHKLSQNA